MDALIIIILILAVLSVWRYLNQQYAAVKFRGRLHNIRLELAKLIADGSISKHDKTALMIDQMIRNGMKSYISITLFRVIVTVPRMKEPNDEIKKFYNELNKNKHLVHIHKRFALTTYFYIKEQHIVSYYFFIIPLVKLGLTFINIRDKVNSYIDNFAIQGKSNNKLVYS